jgi:glycosyltransferase involved in cell wall biosynthesis/predicted O-methyltransferase YrrM
MEEPAALFDRILAAYKAEGFAPDLIGQWTLPAQDAVDLVSNVRVRQPKAVLEVGTFVGVSTMLIALAGGKATRIVSIDPNFPLAVEMSSMGSTLGSLDAGARTHDVAAAVARRLGIAGQIDLLSGGFSSNASFASRRASPDLTIPIIGPDVCLRYGPFDLAFIDGLHYADVVYSDVALASRHLSPNGVILAHDCVGMWGTNVRVGLSRFLAEHSDWALLHPPLSELYRSIGVLFRKRTQPQLESQLLRRPSLPPSVEVQLRALASFLTHHVKPDHIVEIVDGESICATKFDPSIPVETLSLNPEGLAARLNELASEDAPAVLVVSAGGPDLLDANQLRQVFSTIAQNHAVAAFLRTPPGEDGSACINSRPLREWLRIAAAAGATVGALPLLDLAASKFLFTMHSDQTPDSSALCNLALIVAARPAKRFEKAVLEQLTIIDEWRADQLEQEDLLNVHYAGGFRWAFRQLAETKRLLADSNAEVQGRLSTINDLQSTVADLQRQNAELNYQLFGTEHAVESALAHAMRHSRSTPCVMLGSATHSAIIDKLLADPRVGSVCIWDTVPTQLAKRHASDSRVGRYYSHGDWSPPSPCETVYFVGSRRHITPAVLLHASRAGVQQFWVRLGFLWLCIPTQLLRRWTIHFHAASRLTIRAREAVARIVSRARKTKFLPLPAALVGRFVTLDEACRILVKNARPRSDNVRQRIVLVCGSLQPGGAERQVANTLIGLIEEGFTDVSLLAHLLGSGPAQHNFHLPRVLAAGGCAREIERATTGINDRAIPHVLRSVARSLPFSLFADIANLVHEFERLRPEVMHAWLDWDNVRAGLAAAITGVPKIVLSGRNLNPRHFVLYQPYMDPAYRALATLPNVTILNNSRAGGDDYADWIGIPREQVQVIHNGIAFADQRRLAPDAISGARRELGISAGDVVVGGVFRFEKEKQPLLWLEVAAQIHRAVPETRFLLYGQGSLRDAMEAKIRDLQLTDRVIFAGVTEDPLAAMSLMNVFLLTSYGEGLPNVLLEAQLVGTPVVSTRAGGAPEAVDCGVSGWVVDIDSPQALAAAAINILRDPEVAAKAAARGPFFVREHFGTSRMIAETLQAYGLCSPAKNVAFSSDLVRDKIRSEAQAS